MIASTVAGLAAVLAFHTTPAHLSLGPLPAASATRSATVPSTTPPTTSSQSTGGASPPKATSPTTSPPTTSSPTTAPASMRTATGQPVNYNYGILSVSVRATGRTITNVSIGSLDDGGNFRSQSIDQQAIPILEQQALQAQSARIQGVSGASYTSAGFAQSLQSALTKLGL